MQPEPSDAPASSPQIPSNDPKARQRIEYTALIASMREQNERIVSRELQYLDAQVKSGELAVDSNDYRLRLDAIDAMRRSCHVRGVATYTDPCNPTSSRTQGYVLTIDARGDIWAVWDSISGGDGDIMPQPQPSGKRLYLSNPDAPQEQSVLR